MTHHLVFISDLGLTEDLFKSQISVLKTSSICHIFDHQQHDNFEDMVSAFLNNAPEKFSIIAHAMGGQIAFEILKQSPERVEKLIILSTSAQGEHDDTAQHRHEMINLAENHHFDHIIFQSYPKLVHPAYGDDPVLFSKVAEMFSKTGPEVYINQQKALLNNYARLDELAHFSCPTLLLYGEQDQITPPEVGEEIASRLPHAIFEILPACGHLPPLEAPDRVNEKIMNFLQNS